MSALSIYSRADTLAATRMQLCMHASRPPPATANCRRCVRRARACTPATLRPSGVRRLPCRKAPGGGAARCCVSKHQSPCDGTALLTAIRFCTSHSRVIPGRHHFSDEGFSLWICVDRLLLFAGTLSKRRRRAGIGAASVCVIDAASVCVLLNHATHTPWGRCCCLLCAACWPLRATAALNRCDKLHNVCCTMCVVCMDRASLTLVAAGKLQNQMHAATPRQLLQLPNQGLSCMLADRCARRLHTSTQRSKEGATGACRCQRLTACARV